MVYKKLVSVLQQLPVMENRSHYNGLQYDINHALNKLQHQNLLQQQTAHSIELDVQNVCLKITDLKSNQSELSENITKLSELVKVEIDLKDQLITYLRKELDACLFLCKDYNTQYKREENYDVPTLGKPAVKKFKTKDNETDRKTYSHNVQPNQRHEKNLSLSDTCKQKNNKNNGSSKYCIFDKYKCELERKRNLKIVTNSDDSAPSRIAKHVDKKAKEINKITEATINKDIPKENQSVEMNNRSKNTSNNLLKVDHGNDEITAEKEKKLSKNQGDNELKDKVNIGKKVMSDVADRSDTKAMFMLMEDLKKLVKVKTNLQKSTLNDVNAKNKNSLPVLMLEKITTNDVTLTETSINCKRGVDLMEVEKTPNTINIINKIVAQEMKSIDINANEFKSSLQQKQMVQVTKKEKTSNNKKVTKNAVKNGNILKTVENKDKVDKKKASTKEVPTRVLRSTMKRCIVNDEPKKIDRTVKPDKVINQQNEDLDFAQNVKVSIPLNNLDDSFPVLHIPETENSVLDDSSIDKKLIQNCVGSTAKLECILEKNYVNSDLNIDILKEDLNISSLDESDLHLSTHKVCSIDCSLNSPNNSLDKQTVHSASSSGSRKKRRVVITMVD